MSKAAVTSAVSDLATSISDLGTKWVSFVSAFATYHDEVNAANLTRGVQNLENCLSLERMRSLVVQYARAQRLGYLFEPLVISRANGLSEMGVTPDSSVTDLSA